MPGMASAKAAAEVKASKGPVQITLSFDKTKVKTRKSLWYKLGLKNIGKKKIRIDDSIFKDPWAMNKNSTLKRGIYLEVVDAKGKPLTVRPGGDEPHYDWEPKRNELLPYTKEEQKEIATLRADWGKRGLTPRQQSLALNDWNNRNNTRKNMAELADPAKQYWLEPGTSTSTFAWMDRGPGDYAGRDQDDEALRRGYTQLWSYRFLNAGKYRVRAVYNLAQKESNEDFIKRYGVALDPWWVEFKTPFIEFEVVR